MDKLLSPKQLAQAIGASESSLRRWADEGLIQFSRTGGGHRRISLAEAVRFVRETQAHVVRPELFGIPGAATARTRETRDPAHYDQPMVDALTHGDPAQVDAIILGMYLQGHSVAAICDGPIRHAMTHIGELWKHGDRGVFVEHRATGLCLRALMRLQQTLITAQPDAPAAVGAAPAGDPYILPSLMVSLVLTDLGYHSTNLGADTPAPALMQAVRDQHARLVWLSMTAPIEPQTQQKTIQDIAQQLQTCDASLVVGGRRVPEHLPHQPRNVHVAQTMTELAAFARGVLS